MFKSVCKSLVMTCLLALTTTAWAGDAHWIDVRTADEFSADHVDGAVNIPYGDINQRIAEVTGDNYCKYFAAGGIAAVRCCHLNVFRLRCSFR